MKKSLILILSLFVLFSCSGNKLIETNNEECIQVISYAVNPDTGKCETFGNPCIIPKNYKEVGTCKNDLENKKTIYTSFYPIYFITKSLIGEQANVINLVPPGGEPHEFEPTLKQIADMEKSDLIILNGLGMESYEEKLLEKFGTGKIILANERLNNLIKINKDEAHGHEHGDIDPHTWLSPKVYKEIANIIEKELEKAGFTSLDKSFLIKLDELEKSYSIGLKNCEVKELVTAHVAFGYLARDYALIQHPVFGISPEEEPSAKDIANVVDLIKKEKLQYIFSEEFISPKFTETIKKETGVEVLTLHPLESLSNDEELANENYVSIMTKNLEKLKVGLICK